MKNKKRKKEVVKEEKKEEKKETTSIGNKKDIILLGGIILFIILLYALYSELYVYDFLGLRERWVQCVYYLDNGTFWNGQPYCDGGPIVHYTNFLMYKLVGIKNLQITILILNTILNGILFYFLYKVYQKESEKKKYLLLFIFYLALIYITVLPHIEVIMLSTFLFIGYYFLFYSETKYKYYLSGLCFAFAILSKFNGIIPTGFMILYYYIREGLKIQERKIYISKERSIYLNIIRILAPIIILFGIFQVKYRYLLVYLFLTQIKTSIERTYFETVKTIINPSISDISIGIIGIVIILGICFYQFYKKPKFHSFMASFVLMISIFLTLKSFGVGLGFMGEYRYWVHLQPFIILTLLELYESITEKALHKALFGTGMVLILVFPAAYPSPLIRDYYPVNFIEQLHPFTKEKFEFMSELNYGYSIVPEQEGKILVEWGQPHYIDEQYLQFTINIPKEELMSITNSMAPTHPDVWQIDRFQELLGDKLIYDPAGLNELTGKEKKLVSEIENGTYSLIMFGPPNWFVTQRVLNNVNQSILSQYCSMIVPNNFWLTREGMHSSVFYFKNQTQCTDFATDLYSYYIANVGDICKKDQESANEIINLLQLKEHYNVENCKSGIASLEFFKANGPVKTWQFITMNLLIIGSLLLFYSTMHAEFRRNERIFLYMILGIVVAISIIIYINGYSPLP